MADGTTTPTPSTWTIALSDKVATNRRLAGTLRRVPAHLVPDDHPAEADIRLILRTEAAGEPHGRVPQVVVSDGIDETVVRAVMRSGAAGIITSDVTIEEAQAILSAVVAGSFPVPHDLTIALASRLEPLSAAVLTNRDRVILDHLARGDTITAIAGRLGCSERHTRRRLRTLWDKMGVDGRAQGLVAAARRGLLTP